ncbi:MAG: GNAT family N-acetyltransferase [Caldilineaceae bacterium]|nr:GNAT family N-acetyltransferase [Caldilineaceae bacterium]
MSTFEIRPYHPTDLTALYRICLGTGDSGQDATHLYNDPDVIGHYYAAPYAVLEPELAFVLTHNGHAIGYVLGAADTAAFGHRCETEWFPPLRARYAMPAEDDTSRDANMIRAIYRGHRREENDASYPAHLHIDILPAGQGMGWGKRLIQTLTDAMRRQGIPGVYLGVGRRNANAVGFYQHVGFHTLQEEDWGYVFGMRLGA